MNHPHLRRFIFFVIVLLLVSCVGINIFNKRIKFSEFESSFPVASLPFRADLFEARPNHSKQIGYTYHDFVPGYKRVYLSRGPHKRYYAVARLYRCAEFDVMAIDHTGGMGLLLGYSSLSLITYTHHGDPIDHLQLAGHHSTSVTTGVLKADLTGSVSEYSYTTDEKNGYKFVKGALQRSSNFKLDSTGHFNIIG